MRTEGGHCAAHCATQISMQTCLLRRCKMQSLANSIRCWNADHSFLAMHSSYCRMVAGMATPKFCRTSSTVEYPLSIALTYFSVQSHFLPVEFFHSIYRIRSLYDFQCFKFLFKIPRNQYSIRLKTCDILARKKSLLIFQLVRYFPNSEIIHSAVDSISRWP